MSEDREARAVRLTGAVLDVLTGENPKVVAVVLERVTAQLITDCWGEDQVDGCLDIFVDNVRATIEVYRECLKNSNVKDATAASSGRTKTFLNS